MTFLYDYNLGQNIRRHFYILAQISSTSSEMELDHYHQKVNVRVASQVPKHFEILRKSQWRVPSRSPIRQILTVVPEN